MLRDSVIGTYVDNSPVAVEISPIDVHHYDRSSSEFKVSHRPTMNKQICFTVASY
jgi:hypothetical protein